MDEVWDPHWFGSTKTLDVHISWLRKKLDDGAGGPGISPPSAVSGSGSRPPRRRLVAAATPPEEGRSTKLRTRLVLAFGYTLLIVIVALTIPLAVNLRSRARTELESQALLSAQTIAAGLGKEGLQSGTALNHEVAAYAVQSKAV